MRWAAMIGRRPAREFATIVGGAVRGAKTGGMLAGTGRKREPDERGSIQPSQFDWPPSERDLSELATVALEGMPQLIVAEPARSETAIPGAPPTAPASREIGSTGLAHRSRILAALILLGLGLAMGVGIAVLRSPRPGSAADGSLVDAGGRDAGATSTRRSGATTTGPSTSTGGASPDVTVIAEYAPNELRRPRGTLQGDVVVSPPVSPTVFAPPPSLSTSPNASLPSSGVLAGVAPPSAPPVATVAPPRAAALTPPPAAATPPTATVPSPAVSLAVSTAAARTDIEALLTTYRSAYSRLDARAASRVWPSVDAEELARAFGSLSRQELTFERCSIAIRDRAATADCQGSLRYIPRVGRSNWQERSAAWSFDLAKAGDDWTISQVRAR